MKGDITINKIEYIGKHDCIDLINKLKEKDIKVDSIITDPPFNISVKNNFHTMKGRKGIDFGEWDKDFDLLSWIKPSLEILKDGGNIIIFNDWKNMSYIKNELIKHNCLIKEMIIWHKTNPMPRNRDRLYVTSCEFAIWATKGKGWTFNRQKDTYENTIFTYPLVSNKDRIHPTQKPLLLWEYLINSFSNENELILDNCMGSGTTAVAAINTNRNYIGFELDKNYYNIANKRIDEQLKSKL